MKTEDTLRSQLVKVTQAIVNSTKKGVTYEIPCKDCLLERQGEPWRNA